MQPAIKLSPLLGHSLCATSAFSFAQLSGPLHNSDPFVFLISASKISASNPSNWPYAINARYSLFLFDGASANHDPRACHLT